MGRVEQVIAAAGWAAVARHLTCLAEEAGMLLRGLQTGVASLHAMQDVRLCLAVHLEPQSQGGGTIAASVFGAQTASDECSKST